jgi:large subunit ribosomal protein L4
MKIKVINFDSVETGSIDVNDAVFAVEPRQDVLARVIHWQLAKRRAGTHKTKGISEISGTGKKPYKQKGTGSARQGSLRSPQFRGGARIFGPVVRDHGYSLNKKIRRLGLRMALSAKAASGDLLILDNTPSVDKTKQVVEKLATLELTNSLFILQNTNDNSFAQAAANVKNVDVLPSIGANVYSIMKRKKLVLTQEAVKELEARLV